MKTLIIAAAAAATLAAPAVADTAFAIQHFNQDIDVANEIVAVPAGGSTVSVSTSGMSTLGDVFAQFNLDKDRANDLRGLAGATVVTNAPSGDAADIFARIRLESQADE